VGGLKLIAGEFVQVIHIRCFEIIPEPVEQVVLL
jgi:hypothetical protein